MLVSRLPSTRPSPGAGGTAAPLRCSAPSFAAGVTLRSVAARRQRPPDAVARPTALAAPAKGGAKKGGGGGGGGGGAAKIVPDFKGDMTRRGAKALEALAANFATVRTGRAKASLLDRITIDQSGTPTPLKHLATVTAPDSQSILIQPFDKATLAAIDKALRESDVGITPSNDGTVLRLAIPPLTEERRKDLSKQVAKMAEEGKVSLRNQRRDVQKSADALKKDGTLGEDEHKRLNDDLQKVLDAAIKSVEDALKAKDKEISTV